MPIKLEALRVFSAVATHGNIGDAADTLSKTPSSVSMTLKQLEKSLGGPLFEGERKQQLTELGRLTQHVANVQITSYSRAIDSLRAFAQNETGNISIASVHSQINSVMPSILGRFTQERPDVTLDWAADDNEIIAEKVADQAVDLGICEEPPENQGLSFEALLDDPYYVWFSPACPLTRFHRPLSWRDLRTMTLIRCPISDHIQADTYRYLAGRSQFRVSDPATVSSLIQSSRSIAILPAMPVLEADTQLQCRPLTDSRARRLLGLVRSANAPSRPGVEIISALIRSHYSIHSSPPIGTSPD